MQDYGLVSIITPNWNCEKFIAQTIESVLTQTYQNWELLIQDDCSIDRSLSVAKEYAEKDARIKVQNNFKNNGAAVSRNNALRRAKGRWIAFLDSDDLWSPDKLEKQLRFMVENRCSFSYTNYSEMDEEGTPNGVCVSGPAKITKAGMYAFCWPGCLTVMYNASVVGLVQIEDIKKNNDYAMWLKVCRKVDCYLLNESLAQYRRGRTGSVSSHSIKTMIKWHYKLFHDAEHMTLMRSMWHTCVNMVCGFYKKIKYVEHVK